MKRHVSEKSPGELASERRRMNMSSDDIQQKIDQVDRLVKEMRATLLTIKSRRIAGMEVDGATKIDRGIDLIQRWSQNLQSSLVYGKFYREGE